jgi:hypothetical protein
MKKQLRTLLIIGLSLFFACSDDTNESATEQTQKTTITNVNFYTRTFGDGNQLGVTPTSTGGTSYIVDFGDPTALNDEDIFITSGTEVLYNYPKKSATYTIAVTASASTASDKTVTSNHTVTIKTDKTFLEANQGNWKTSFTDLGIDLAVKVNTNSIQTYTKQNTETCYQESSSNLGGNSIILANTSQQYISRTTGIAASSVFSGADLEYINDLGYTLISIEGTYNVLNSNEIDFSEIYSAGSTEVLSVTGTLMKTNSINVCSNNTIDSPFLASHQGNWKTSFTDLGIDILFQISEDNTNSFNKLSTSSCWDKSVETNSGSKTILEDTSESYLIAQYGVNANEIFEGEDLQYIYSLGYSKLDIVSAFASNGYPYTLIGFFEGIYPAGTSTELLTLSGTMSKISSFNICNGGTVRKKITNSKKYHLTEKTKQKLQTLK